MVGLCQNHFLRLKFIILIHYIYHLNSLHTYERSQLFILNAIPFCPSFFFGAVFGKFSIADSI